jgi:hypothetical protein
LEVATIESPIFTGILRRNRLKVTADIGIF